MDAPPATHEGPVSPHKHPSGIRFPGVRKPQDKDEMQPVPACLPSPPLCCGMAPFSMSGSLFTHMLQEPPSLRSVHLEPGTGPGTQ